jgi:hypothetical protein
LIPILNLLFQSQNTIRVFEAHQVDFLHQIFKLGKPLTVFSGSLKISTLDDKGEYMKNPSTAIGYLIVDPNWELLKFYGQVNPNGRWLILQTKSVELPAIRKILTSAWHSNYMLHTLVVVSGSDSTKVYLYNPFVGGEAGLIGSSINQSDITQQLKQIE